MTESGEWVEVFDKPLPAEAPFTAAGGVSLSPAEANKVAQSMLSNSLASGGYMVPMPGTVNGEAGWYMSADNSVGYWEVKHFVKNLTNKST